MKTVLIVFHSQSGATAKLAAAVAQGVAMEEGVRAVCKPAMLADASDLAAADAVIFGSPENFGYLSGGLKDFFDRTYYPLLPLQLGTPYAVFISAGNDGSGALRQLERIVKGYPLKPVAEPVIVKGVPDEQALAKAQELGAAIAAGTAMGIF